MATGYDQFGGYNQNQQQNNQYSNQGYSDNKMYEGEEGNCKIF